MTETYKNSRPSNDYRKSKRQFNRQTKFPKFNNRGFSSSNYQNNNINQWKNGRGRFFDVDYKTRANNNNTNNKNVYNNNNRFFNKRFQNNSAKTRNNNNWGDKSQSNTAINNNNSNNTEFEDNRRRSPMQYHQRPGGAGARGRRRRRRMSNFDQNRRQFEYEEVEGPPGYGPLPSVRNDHLDLKKDIALHDDYNFDSGNTTSSSSPEPKCIISVEKLGSNNNANNTKGSSQSPSIDDFDKKRTKLIEIFSELGEEASVSEDNVEKIVDQEAKLANLLLNYIFGQRCKVLHPMQILYIARICLSNDNNNACKMDSLPKKIVNDQNKKNLDGLTTVGKTTFLMLHLNNKKRPKISMKKTKILKRRPPSFQHLNFRWLRKFCFKNPILTSFVDGINGQLCRQGTEKLSAKELSDCLNYCRCNI